MFGRVFPDNFHSWKSYYNHVKSHLTHGQTLAEPLLPNPRFATSTGTSNDAGAGADITSFVVKSLKRQNLRFLFRFQFLCEVDEEYIPKVGMTFETLKEAGLFYKECQTCRILYKNKEHK
ncbi:hypothetical protein PIB30_009409 [Stylosanthes scabra]|uniref:Uncharacterized protein n=1 Tax=Stylosanthes scabra TaxID=79078 RepID=A0ABU6W6B0_9FABA|nr:hypothetical protein [Stylosanthes scabra]